MPKKKLTWELIDVPVKEIKPNPKNPKIRDQKGYNRLKKSMNKFGVVFDAILNKDFSLIDGHSRLEERGPNYIARCFVPSRLLTDKEYVEFNAMFDAAKAGNPDFIMMEEVLTEEVLEEWGYEKPKKNKGQYEAIKPFKKAHVLLSFAPEMMLELTPILQKLKNTEGVEYLQSTN